MCKRSVFAVLGAFLAVAALAAPAEARLEQADGLTPTYGSVTKASMGKNFKAKSNRNYAQYRKGKRYATGKSKRSASAKRYGKYGNRVAYRKKGNRLAKRSLTRYASSGGGGGASRSCLTSEARALLNRIESNFGPVQVISTCRPGAVIAGSGRPSRHRYGQAIDFSAGGRKGAIVNWLRANHHSGGTMTYSDMSHIHVDIGRRFVKLGAPSRRG